MLSERGERTVHAWDVIARIDAPTAIHPSGAISQDAYEQSGLEQAQAIAQLVSRLMPAEPAERFLDFGCGDGRVARWLAQMVSDDYEPLVFAIDSSQTMIDRLMSLPFGDSDRILASVWPNEVLRRVTAPVDVAYALAVLIHHTFDDGANLLAEIAACLRPGGLLLLDMRVYDEGSEADSWIGLTTWTPEQMETAAERAGCELVESWWWGERYEPGPHPHEGKLNVLRRLP